MENKHKGFVCVDIGASSTRFVSNSGKISMIPNNMVLLDEKTEVDLKITDSVIENALELIIRKKGDSDFFPVKALIGNIAERYSANTERPSLMVNKHVQRLNYVSIIAACAMSRLVAGVEEEISLYVALPPIETKAAKSHIEKHMVGEFEVEFPKYNGGEKITIKIKDTECYEESAMAILSFFFSLNGQLKPKAKQYMKGNILSLDIGASTSDLAIVKDGRYLEMSGQTYKTGGNEVRDYVINKISGEYGFELPVGEAERVVSEGRLQMGNSYVDIPEIIDEAKRVWSAKLVQTMQTYFKHVNIPIQTIRAIVVSGGGSLQSQYINDAGDLVNVSEPTSSYITDALKNVCSHVEVEYFGDSPRLANVSGLYIRAHFDMMKKLEQ